MEFLNNISNFFRNIGETFGIVPPKKTDPVKPTEPKETPAEEVPADSLKTGDAIKAGAAAAAAAGALGGAAATLGIVGAAAATAASAAIEAAGNFNENQLQWFANGAEDKARVDLAAITETTDKNGNTSKATLYTTRLLEHIKTSDFTEARWATKEVKNNRGLYEKIHRLDA